MLLVSTRVCRIQPFSLHAALTRCLPPSTALGSDDSVKKNVVVVGSSFIGMEVALAASARANVTVVGMEDAPFQAILGKEIGNGVRKVRSSAVALAREAFADARAYCSSTRAREQR